LRLWLLSRAGLTDGTIGDALAEFARVPRVDNQTAIILLRYLAVPDLLPMPNSTNQISRLATEVCERSLPEICAFLKLDKKKQTFEKFTVLSSAFAKICYLIKPLSMPYGDLDALLAARKEI